MFQHIWQVVHLRLGSRDTRLSTPGSTKRLFLKLARGFNLSAQHNYRKEILHTPARVDQEVNTSISMHVITFKQVFSTHRWKDRNKSNHSISIGTIAASTPQVITSWHSQVQVLHSNQWLFDFPSARFTITGCECGRQQKKAYWGGNKHLQRCDTCWNKRRKEKETWGDVSCFLCWETIANIK